MRYRKREKVSNRNGIHKGTGVGKYGNIQKMVTSSVQLFGGWAGLT